MAQDEIFEMELWLKYGRAPLRLRQVRRPLRIFPFEGNLTKVWRGTPDPLRRRDVLESYEVDVLTRAMFGDLEQIDDTFET